mgnify:CR=1 FL=1
MNLIKKIEEVRRQPEHVRMRYVWTCVAISMMFVVFLWLFSIKIMFSQTKENAVSSGAVRDFSEQLNEFKESVSSLKDLQQPLGSEEGFGVSKEQGSVSDMNEDFQNTPQSQSYSDIKEADEI